MSTVNPAANIWDTVLELLQNEMTPTTIKTWFDDVEAVALDEDEFVIYSPTPWKRDIVVSRYAKFIENALENLFSTKFRVVVLSGDELDKRKTPPPRKISSPVPRSIPSPVSWWVLPTSSPMPPHRPWVRIPVRIITPSISTALPVWARPI